MMFRQAGVMFVACNVFVLIGQAAHGALVADTGFEVVDSYPDPTDSNNGLGGYYDLHDLDGADGRPLADPGEGWGTNSWAGAGHSSSTTYAQRSGGGRPSAYQGDQYAVMRPPSPSADLYLRRKVATGSFTSSNRALFSFAIRVDTPLSAAPYFSGNNPAVMLEYKPDANPDTGDKEVNIELEADGDLVAKRGNLANGNDITVGKWDGSGALASALNGWVFVQLAANLDTEHYYLIWNGTYVGEYKFRSSLQGTPVQELNQLRFTGGKWASGQGISVDAVELRNDFTGVVVECLSDVTPAGIQTVSAWIDEPTIQPIDYTVSSVGLQAVAYTVEELDENQLPADIPWLTLSKTSGSAAPGSTDVVTATFNTSGVSGGVHTAYVKITDACNPAVTHLRQIDLNSIACQWEVNSCNQVRSYLLDYPDMPVAPVVYRITNTGHLPMSYSVAQTGSTCISGLWTLTNDAGTLAPQQFADVTATFHVEALQGQATDTNYSCDLVFTDGCSIQSVSRTIRLRNTAVGSTIIFQYNGDTDPLANDSAGAGVRADMYRDDGVSPNGAVEVDPQAFDGKAWRIQDDDQVKTKYRFTRNSTSAPIEFDNELGATLIARVKVRSHSGATEGGLYIWESDANTATYHWGGPNGLIQEKERGVSATVTGTDEYVILRMTVIGRKDDAWDCSRIIRLYINENATPAIEIAGGSERTTLYEGMGFGAGSTSGTYDIAYDWVVGTDTGAFAPHEEEAVLGFSLVPESCPKDWADLDGDHDVDMIDFGLWQRCFTLPETPMNVPDCRCLDRDFDDDVDVNDATAFSACATGPGVWFDVGQPPQGCQ